MTPRTKSPAKTTVPATTTILSTNVIPTSCSALALPRAPDNASPLNVSYHTNVRTDLPIGVGADLLRAVRASLRPLPSRSASWARCSRCSRSASTSVPSLERRMYTTCIRAARYRRAPTVDHAIADGLEGQTELCCAGRGTLGAALASVHQYPRAVGNCASILMLSRSA